MLAERAADVLPIPTANFRRMIYVWIVLFVVAVGTFWLLNVFGFPGNWFTAALVALWMWLGPDNPPLQIGWPILVAILVLAGVAELIELLASVIGAKQIGGTRRGAWLSLFGSIIGGIAGAVIGFPVPIIGWLAGSIFFACVGALLGAVIGERWAGKPMKESLHVGGMAFAGRFFGTASKVILGSVIAVVAILSLIF